jgi:hypothetical protein
LHHHLAQKLGSLSTLLHRTNNILDKAKQTNWVDLRRYFKENEYFCRQMEGALQLKGRVREMDSKQKLMGSGSDITVGITVPPTMKSL